MLFPFPMQVPAPAPNWQNTLSAKIVLVMKGRSGARRGVDGPSGSRGMTNRIMVGMLTVELQRSTLLFLPQVSHSIAAIAPDETGPHLV